MNNIALFLTHNIFLDQNQIDVFFKKNKIKVLGVSVPVWVNAKTSKTSEPAEEVFCSYEIIISDKNDIELTKNGYKIFLNPSSNKNAEDIDYEKLSNMTEKERTEYLSARDRWWKKNLQQISIKNIKNCGYFRIEIKKMEQKFEKISKYNVDCQHIIEIKSIERLSQSLIR